VVGSEGTDLTGDLTGLTGHAKNVTPNSQVMRKKPSFDKLLHKYQRIADQKQNNCLESKSGILHQ
jgi:hypothetical protein